MRALTHLGLVEDDSFDLRLMQNIQVDFIGLTAIHVNRTMQVLKEDGSDFR